MIGLVLVTHGDIAGTLRAATEHVVGSQTQLATLPIGPHDDIARCREALEACIAQVEDGDGVLLLTDMFGSTPSNLAISMMNRPGIEVIAGVNLPMLVKLAKVRCSRTLDECTAIAELAGRKYIAAASSLPATCLGGAACCGGSAAAPEPAAEQPARPARIPDPALAG
ncbi:PTS sugar transporter subunit IIA [Rhizosaccharibacter radicis]|uniref:PTS sugar transporter subunit IIA n=1 Tax=Rhizosaccharibacter radicis TaxID=2782605 RepID=A0ABT1VU19_9PROT|nr:PTS sugar transporter subunit IIA [Acetobacteraceae bacterium KSS12]